MILETLDIKSNDVVIFSQNLSDLENNFKIIFKDDPDKKIRKINYSEVCRFVNEFSPKNMIIYRLLTNIRNFEIKLTKYGFPIYINGVPELIYFDPVFALKELQEYRGNIIEELRFRIQQVGITTLNRLGNVPNFAEIYSIDLLASEAKNQNDKVFADAIFMNYKSSTPSNKQPVDNAIKEKDIKLIDHEVAEDYEFDYKKIRKMNFRENASQQENNSSLRKFLEEKVNKSSHGIFDGSDSINKLISEREDQRVILKINKS